jgi:hypothetical protein
MATTHKYISSGSYGCVISPAVPCDVDAIVRSGTVSKLFNKKQ